MTFKEVSKILKFESLKTWSFHLNELGSVVYFLLDKGVCVYVGLTQKGQLFRRMSAHLLSKKKGEKIFDEIKMLCVIDDTRARYVERVLIGTINPKYNNKERNDKYGYYSDTWARQWLQGLCTKGGAINKALTGEKKATKGKPYIKRKRITMKEVLAIKERIKNGERCSEIVKDCGFGIATIYKIKAGTHFLCKPVKN